VARDRPRDNYRVRSIYVPLPDPATDRLRELAQRELRDPREQAAWLILDGLRRAGLEVELKSAERVALAPAEQGGR
jgi:hypothetical protein